VVIPLLFSLPLLVLEAAPATSVVRISVAPQVFPKPITGRVFLMTAPGSSFTEPRFGPNWFRPSPFFAKDIQNHSPDSPVVIDDSAISFPAPLSQLTPGKHTIQAVLDLQLGGRDFSDSPGNGYSKPQVVTVGPNGELSADLRIESLVKEKPFPESERVRLVDIKSERLSAFHGREFRLKAAVVLPESYRQDIQRRYPIVYVIPGFSGTHYLGRFGTPRTNHRGVEFISVTLNPECSLGHHVFADSANNGPCGQALIQEMIPHVEKTYRAIGTSATRLVTGHSSGGWSSLWLQVAYPDFFGGVWSTSPDPVDFRDFQQIDLYAPKANMFFDSQGNPRPLARRGTTPVVLYKTFSDMEEVMGHGGQLASFEAVFSPKMPDGLPRKLWNRKTGAIDPVTAEAWKAYDIRLKLEKEWPTIGTKLAGKLHVYTGELDTFYLEGAVKLLKQSLTKLKSDAVVEIFPGKDHGSILDARFRDRLSEEMAQQIRKALQE
jgi:S-formylglutathione hydrolase FrmB